MLPPQGTDEVSAVELELQKLDRRISLHWNPQAEVITPGFIDVYGKAVPARRDGRWEVRLKTDDGIEAVLYVVRDADTGAYKPIGSWLVAQFRAWDAENVEAVEARAQMWSDHDKNETERKSGALDDEATNFFERKYSELGGKHIDGVGF